jgi:hypothetical protein
MMVAPQPNSLSVVIISLMKGVTDRDSDPALWQSMLGLEARVRDHVSVLGLDLILDEAEGFAYLRQKNTKEGEPEIPKLVQRRQLGYQVSLLLALLRKKLVEFDASSGDARLILSRGDMVEMMRVFLPDTANQVRLTERIDANISRIVEMGFLRRLRTANDSYEIRRIIKAFVDAQWLSEFEQRLAAYRTHLSNETDQGADANEHN